jgi:hypothetical protein
MSVSKDKAQSLCTPTEWKTVVNSFPPKLSDLGSSVAKKNASRIARFLSKAENDGESERVTVLQEALERLQAAAPDKKDEDKLSVRRQKEKKAREKAQEQKSHRAEVREKLLQKAEEEKAEKEKSEDENAEGESEVDEAKESRPKGTRARLQAAAAISSQDKS